MKAVCMHWKMLWRIKEYIEITVKHEMHPSQKRAVDLIECEE